MIWGNQSGDTDAGGGTLSTVTITVATGVGEDPAGALTHGIEWGGTAGLFNIAGIIFTPTFATSPRFVDNSPGAVAFGDVLISDLTAP
ncbi:MAG TPA: hypothetical protein VFD27_13950 [Chthoniobacteraceae bacterium]|nr:hypothetical protein [Chthoniobacteraceae bacterium]